jgi:hypothetical protein
MGLNKPNDEGKIEIFKDPNVLIGNDFDIHPEWKVEIHHTFDIYFKKRILLLVLLLKFYHKKNTHLKLPKFVLFEIIKFVSLPPYLSSTNDKAEKNDKCVCY